MIVTILYINNFLKTHKQNRPSRNNFVRRGENFRERATLLPRLVAHVPVTGVAEGSLPPTVNPQLFGINRFVIVELVAIELSNKLIISTLPNESRAEASFSRSAPHHSNEPVAVSRKDISHKLNAIPNLGVGPVNCHWTTT